MNHENNGDGICLRYLNFGEKNKDSRCPVNTGRILLFFDGFLQKMTEPGKIWQ